MLKTPLYNQKGEEIGKVELPANVFEEKYRPDLIIQALEAYRSNRRKPVAHAKGRGEVRGGGRKPWKQKGTGRARHGSRRSPLWKGGGATFGPTKERNFTKILPKKMARAALRSVLSKKLQDNEIKVLDDIKMNKPKTKELAGILANLLSKSRQYQYQRGIIIMPGPDKNISRSARNLPFATSREAASLNVYEILNYRYLILLKESIKVLEKTFGREKIKAGKSRAK